MSLFQKAFQAGPLLPTLGSPYVCPHPHSDSASRRPLLDWEPPDSKDMSVLTAFLNMGEGAGNDLLGEGGRSQPEESPGEGGGWEGREGREREVPDLGSRSDGWALPLPLPCFMSLLSTDHSLTGNNVLLIVSVISVSH